MVLCDDAEDVAFGDDEDFLAAVFDFGAAVFGNEDFVADLDGEDNVVAFLILAAGSEAEDFCFLWLFLCGVWKDDSARADRIGF